MFLSLSKKIADLTRTKNCWIFVDMGMKLLCSFVIFHETYESKILRVNAPNLARQWRLDYNVWIGQLILGHAERRENYVGVLWNYVASKRVSFCKIVMARFCFISVVHFSSNGWCMGFQVSTQDGFPPDTFSRKGLASVTLLTDGMQWKQCKECTFEHTRPTILPLLATVSTRDISWFL
jgi:hypothetical protein